MTEADRKAFLQGGVIVIPSSPDNLEVDFSISLPTRESIFSRRPGKRVVVLLFKLIRTMEDLAEAEEKIERSWKAVRVPAGGPLPGRRCAVGGGASALHFGGAPSGSLLRPAGWCSSGGRGALRGSSERLGLGVGEVGAVATCVGRRCRCVG